MERRPSSCNQFVRTTPRVRGYRGAGNCLTQIVWCSAIVAGPFSGSKGAISTGGKQIRRFAPSGGGNTEAEPLSSDSQSAKCEGEIPGLSLGRSKQWKNKDNGETNATLGTWVRTDNLVTAARHYSTGAKLETDTVKEAIIYLHNQGES